MQTEDPTVTTTLYNIFPSRVEQLDGARIEGIFVGDVLQKLLLCYAQADGGIETVLMAPRKKPSTRLILAPGAVRAPRAALPRLVLAAIARDTDVAQHELA